MQSWTSMIEADLANVTRREQIARRALRNYRAQCRTNVAVCAADKRRNARAIKTLEDRVIDIVNERMELERRMLYPLGICPPK